MQAVANDAAGHNGVASAVVLNIPTLTGPAAGDPQAVEVIVTELAAGLLHRPVPCRSAADHDPRRRQGGGLGCLRLGAPSFGQRSTDGLRQPRSIWIAAW
jgi:hypothetical protein